MWNNKQISFIHKFATKKLIRFFWKNFIYVPKQPEGVGPAVMVACVKLFPRALMKRIQLIDEEGGGSGN